MNYYPGDVTTLSDDELHQLKGELHEAGVVFQDRYDYDPEDWMYQAIEHYDKLDAEVERRWELANPEAVEKREQDRRPYSEIVGAAVSNARPQLMSIFEDSVSLMSMLRRQRR